MLRMGLLVVADAPHSPVPSLTDIFGPGGRLSRCLPIYEYREEQIRSAELIHDAIRRRQGCLIEAGTGVGKTLAYLAPIAFAIAEGLVVVLSTYTINLQTQLIEKDIPILAEAIPEAPLRPFLLKGRSNYLCKLDLDHAAADLIHASDPQFSEILAWAQRTQTGDMAELPRTYPHWHDIAAKEETCRGKDCRYFNSCHYYAARRAALAANLIVVNHALLMTDAAQSAGILPHYDVLVIDEAHHLEDAATAALTLSIDSAEVPAFCDRLERSAVRPDVRLRSRGLRDLHHDLFERFDDGSYDFTLSDRLDHEGMDGLRLSGAVLQTELAAVANDLTDSLPDEDDTARERREGLSQTAGLLADAFSGLLAEPSDGDVLWCSVASRPARKSNAAANDLQGLTLHRTPLAIARCVADLLWSRTPAVVMTSATLATSEGFSYLRQRLGFDGAAIEAVIGSPFDYPTQALLYIPNHISEPSRNPLPAYYDAIAEEMIRLIALTSGRAFLLFTSRKALSELYTRLRSRIPNPLFRQGDRPPQKLLQVYRESGNGVLLGNQTFWEGVDIQGDALSAVVIDRIPFAVPDSPITRARSEELTRAGGDPFRQLSLPQAQIRLKQGFGRLIRTRSDRGIVCVLDSRLLTRGYGQQFLRTLPPARLATDWEAVVEFWHDRS